MLAAGPETGRIRASVEHQVELSAENLWEEISGRLKEALSDGTYSKWFGDVRGLELDDDTLVLVVPSEFTRDWIESNFLGLIGAAVRDILGGERALELQVRRATRIPRRRAARGLRASFPWSNALPGGPRAAVST